MVDKIDILAWLILFLPLFAAVIIMLFTRRNARLSALLSIGAIVVSFLFSMVVVAILRGNEGVTIFSVNWLALGEFRVDFGLQFDPLSELMLLVVTGVGSAIHIYSYAYMHDDRSFARFFGSLSLFTFSMLGIVLSCNFVQMFIFWELVGVSSYLLIGFWYERPAAADACKKAFITNRLGVFGFLLGIILVWSAVGSGNVGTLNFEVLKARLASNFSLLTPEVATIAGLLLFCGAMGKSAQFPLHVWLPDAMEGPTPVSALIHAATMVAAGVFMLCRIYFLLDIPGSMALDVIAHIGGLTALLAALMAVQQNDIKRILAYSTLSQLGYMVMAVGLHGPTPAMYHLTTHAFFKALLFLGAGSVIHALHHEQDIWKMGALRNKLPVTFWTFLIGTLALCGVPPLSGFYSKDSILAVALEHNLGLFGVAVFVAFLTTFYMSRLMLVAFFGPAKSQAPDHAHESPPVMTVPLVVLAVLSVTAGFFGLDHFIGRQFNVVAAHGSGWQELIFGPFNHSPLAALCGLGAVVFGFSIACGQYWNAVTDPLPRKLGVLARSMRDRFYFDEIYAEVIAKTQDGLAKFADGFDRWIVAGFFVKGGHGTVELVGRALRLVQTGNLQTYTFLFVGGVAVVLFFVLFR